MCLLMCVYSYHVQGRVFDGVWIICMCKSSAKVYAYKRAGESLPYCADYVNVMTHMSMYISKEDVCVHICARESLQ